MFKLNLPKYYLIFREIHHNLLAMKNNFKITLLITCFFSLSIFSQNYVAKYNFVSNGGFSAVFSSTLYLPENGNKSFLIDYSQRKILGDIREDSGFDNYGNPVHIVTIDNGIDKELFVFDQEEKTVSYNQTVGSKQFIVKDALPAIKWTITNETKEVESRKLVKATCTFRGRNWTAWFAPDISVYAGPWKLQGLPGLIIEAKDDTNRYEFALSDFREVKEETKVFLPEKTDEISLQKFCELEKEHEEAISMKLRANMSRAETLTTETMRDGLELIYEWEEE